MRERLKLLRSGVGLLLAATELLAAAIAQPPVEQTPMLSPRLLWQDRPLGRVITLRVCDLNNDGRDEIVVGTAVGEIVVLSGSKIVHKLTPITFPIWRLAVSDLDGNGAKEILAVSAGSLHVLRAAGEELWKVEAPTQAGARGITGVEAADLDGNATTEVLTVGDEVACRAADGKVLWTFASKAQNVALGDLDGDGHREVVLASPLTVLSHDGQVKWTKPAAAPDQQNAYFTLQMADVTGDELPEVILTFRNRVEVFDRKGSLLWSAQTDSWRSAVKPARTAGDGARIAAAINNYEVQVWNGEGKPLHTVQLGPRGSGYLAGPLEFIDLEPQPELVIGSLVTEPYVTAFDREGRVLWKRYVGASVRGLCGAEVDGDAGKELVALADAIYVLDSDGELLWWHPAGANTFVAATAAEKDRESAVFAGAATVRRYKADGSLVWESDVPCVYEMTLANLDGDPQKEIVIGGEDNVALAMEQDGSVKWQTDMYTPYVRVAAANLDGDPQDEVVVADWYAYRALDSDGRLLWPGQMTYLGNMEPVRGLSVGRLGGGVRDQVLLWCNKGFHAFSASGVQLWEVHNLELPLEVQVGAPGRDTVPKVFVLGKGWLRSYSASGQAAGELKNVNQVHRRDWFAKGTGLLFHDLDGDKAPEIIAGLGFLEPFLAEGEHFWPNECRCGATTLQMGDLDGDGKKEIVTAYQGPYVVSREGQVIGRWGDREFTYSFSVADLDGDGCDEVVAGGSGTVVLQFTGADGGDKRPLAPEAAARGDALRVSLTNRGEKARTINLTYRLLDERRGRVAEGRVGAPDMALQPGEVIECPLELEAAKQPGAYTVKLAAATENGKRVAKLVEYGRK